MSSIRKSSRNFRAPRARMKSCEIIGVDISNNEVYLVKFIGKKILEFDEKCDVTPFVACFNVLVLLARRIHASKTPNLLKATLSLIRCGLWSGEKEIRCAALRCLRYFLRTKSDVRLLIQLRLDYLIGRSLDLSWEDSNKISYRHMDESERVQALRCVWLICELAPDLIPTDAPSLLRPLLDELSLPPRNVAVPPGANVAAAAPNGGMSVQHGLHVAAPWDKQMTSSHNAKDQSLQASVLLMCHLSVLCPAAMAKTEVDRILIHAMLNHFTDACSPEHARRLCEATVLALLHLLDSQQGRLCLSQGQIEKLLTPITRLSHEQVVSKSIGSSPNADYTIDQLKIAKQALLLTLHSWPGLLYFCQPDSHSMLSLIGILRVGHTDSRRDLLDLFFDLFLLPKPSCLTKCNSSGNNNNTSKCLDISTSSSTPMSSSSSVESFQLILQELRESVDKSKSGQYSVCALSSGFVAAEALSLLPYRAPCKIDLVENQLALTLVLLLECGLLEALCEAVLDKEDSVAMSATVLLGQLIHMTTLLLPSSHPTAQRMDTLRLLGSPQAEVAVHRMERLHKVLLEMSDFSVHRQRVFSPFLFYICAQANADNHPPKSNNHEENKKQSKSSEFLDQMVYGSRILHFQSVSLVTAGDAYQSIRRTTESPAAPRGHVTKTNAATSGYANNGQTPTGGSPIASVSGAKPYDWDWDLIVCFMKRLNDSRNSISVRWDENANVQRLLRTLMDFFSPPMPLMNSWTSSLQFALPNDILVVQPLEFSTGEFQSNNSETTSTSGFVSQNNFTTINSSSNSHKSHSSSFSGTPSSSYQGQFSSSSTSSAAFKPLYSTNSASFQTAINCSTIFLAPVFCQQPLDWRGAKRAAHSLVEFIQHLSSFPENSEPGKRIREFLRRYQLCLVTLLRHIQLHRGGSNGSALIAQDDDHDNNSSSSPNHTPIARFSTNNSHWDVAGGEIDEKLSASLAAANAIPSFATESLHRAGCLRFIFLAVGRLTASEKGDELLEESGIVQRWRDLIVHSEETSIVKLILSSLDYTRRSLSRALLNAATTSMCESTRLYAAQLIRVLYRAKLPFFSSWCVDLLVHMLQDTSSRVVLESMEALQEACEDEVNVSHFHPHCASVAHLGYPGVLLVTRLLGNDFIFQKLKQTNVVTFLMDEWMKKYQTEYVRHVELGLLACFTSIEPRVQEELNLEMEIDGGGESNHGGGESQHNSNFHEPWTSISGLKSNCIRPTLMLHQHPYAALCQHKEGLDLLLFRGDLVNCLNTLHNNNNSGNNNYNDDVAMKAALWAIGHVCSTTLGLEWAEKQQVLSILTNLAYFAPSLSIRGTAVFCLSLVASTPRGADCLQAIDWFAVRNNRWHLLTSSSSSSAMQPYQYTYISQFSSAPSSPGDTLSSLEADTLNRFNKILLEGEMSEDDLMEFVKPSSSIPRMSRQDSLGTQQSLPPLQSNSLGRNTGREWCRGMTSCNHSPPTGGGSQLNYLPPPPLSQQDVHGYAELSRLHHLSFERQLADKSNSPSTNGTVPPNSNQNENADLSTSNVNLRKISSTVTKLTQYRGLSVPLSMSMLGNQLYPQVTQSEQHETHWAALSHFLHPFVYNSNFDETDDPPLPITASSSLLLTDGDLLAPQPPPPILNMTITDSYDENDTHLHTHTLIDDEQVVDSIPHVANLTVPCPPPPPSRSSVSSASLLHHETRRTCLWQSCPGANQCSSEVQAQRAHIVNVVQALLQSRSSRQFESELLNIRDTKRESLEDCCLISEVACRLHSYQFCPKQARVFVHELFFGIRPPHLYEDADELLTSLTASDE